MHSETLPWLNVGAILLLYFEESNNWLRIWALERLEQDPNLVSYRYSFSLAEET